MLLLVVSKNCREKTRWALTERKENCLNREVKSELGETTAYLGDCCENDGRYKALELQSPFLKVIFSPAAFAAV